MGNDMTDMDFFLRNLHEALGVGDEDNQEVKEKNYLETVSIEEANKILSEDCSAYQKQQLTYHLIDRTELQGKEGDFFVYDPLQADRPYNKLYNVIIMDKSEGWSDYPKRKNAIVCYPNKDKITDDGVTFVVVPFDRTRLGVAPKETLDDSFNNVSINLGMKFEYFNRSFNIVLNVFNNPEGTYEPDTKKLTLTNEKFYDHSYAEAKQAMQRADEKMQSDEGKQVVAGILAEPYNKETEANVISILEYLQAKGTTLEEMINTLFDPSENSFKHMPFKNFVVGELKDKELWFNNKALLVRESEYETLQFPEHGFADTSDASEGGEEEFSDEEPTNDEEEVVSDEEPSSEEPEVSNDEVSDEEPVETETIKDEPLEIDDGPVDEPSSEEPEEDEDEDEEDKIQEESYSMKTYKDLI